MRLAKVLGAIGRTLISAGAIVLLFVGYQLWGTNIQASAAQGELAKEAESLFALDADQSAEIAALEALRASSTTTTAETADSSASDSSGDADQPAQPSQAALAEFDLTDVSQELVAKVYPEEGAPLARIEIPSIGVDHIVVEGVSVEDLRKGPGHYRNTPNPGQAGNSAIAGHRTTYGQPFHRVDELEPGASIFVTTAQGKFEYTVNAHESPEGQKLGYFIVYPQDTYVLDSIDERNTLTLTACHPKYSARQRIIVQAELVGEPVVTIPKSEAGSTTASISREGSQLASEASAESADEEFDDTNVVISDAVARDDDPETQELAEQETTSEAASSEAETSDTDDQQDTAGAVSSDEPTNTPGSETVSVELADTDALTAELEATSVEEGFGAGLDGDPTKVRPALMWGLAAAAIWLMTWFITHRTKRKITPYVVFILPFALVLWSCFVNVDQALPSY